MVYVILGLQNATGEHQADPEVLDCLNLKVTKENISDMDIDYQVECAQ